MIPEFPNFKKLELSDKEAVEKFTQKYPPYSDFNFVSIWSWNVDGEMKISQLNGNLVVRFIDYITNEPFYSFLGDNTTNETAETLLELSRREGITLQLKLMPEDSIKGLNDQKFKIVESRDNFDYVYSLSSLYECNGKAYEKQRLRVNGFCKKYSGIEVRLLSLESAKHQIIELSEKWRMGKQGRENEVELKKESDSIKRIFYFVDKNLFSICIFHNENLIAYSIVEVLGNGYALLHFWKADTSFVGIYSYLMRQNSHILLEQFNIKHLNFEQDLGKESLRASKNEFRPALFLKKYFIASIAGLQVPTCRS